MARFCTKCGKPLDENGKCNCSPQGDLSNLLEKAKLFIGKILHRMGIGGRTPEEAANLFENGKQIVPDVIGYNENEIPVKQYNLAQLRSRIVGKLAYGRLMITNKRVIFRAPGASYRGKELLQYEINIDDIGGVEFKKTNRVSLLSLVLGFLLTLIVEEPVSAFFGFIYKHSSVSGILIGTLVSFVMIAMFFMIKNKFWLKLLGLAVAISATDEMTGSITEKAFGYIMGESVFNILDVLGSVVFILWIWNMILLALVPDLRFCVRSKSFGEGLSIRRKIWGFFLKQHNEYTDYSEVLPWTDADTAIDEVGAIIHDIQTMGDLAIEKWKVE